MQHQKVSGQTNSQPDKVGGEDWDAVHAYGHGDLAPLAVARVLWDGATFSRLMRSTRVSAWDRVAPGLLSFTLNLSGFVVGQSPALAVAVRPVFSIYSRGGVLSGYKIDLDNYDSESHEVTISFRATADDSAVDPPVPVDISVTFWADVFINF